MRSLPRGWPGMGARGPVPCLPAPLLKRPCADPGLALAPWCSPDECAHAAAAQVAPLEARLAEAAGALRAKDELKEERWVYARTLYVTYCM